MTNPRPAALINVHCAYELVDSRPTGHISAKLISAVEVDPRGGGLLVARAGER